MTDPGLPLAYFLTADRCIGVEVHCLACQGREVFPVAAVLRKLKARKIEGEVMGIKTLAVVLTAPCRRCGSKNRRTGPAWA